MHDLTNIIMELKAKTQVYLDTQKTELRYAHEREGLCVVLIEACEGGHPDHVVAAAARMYIEAKKRHLLATNCTATALDEVRAVWCLWSSGEPPPERAKYIAALTKALDDCREQEQARRNTCQPVTPAEDANKEPGKDTP